MSDGLIFAEIIFKTVFQASVILLQKLLIELKT